MARIRTLKPEIHQSPQVMNVCLESRYLFVGLITMADDEGRESADPRKLKAAIFPGDEDMNSNRIGVLLLELCGQRLIQVYEVPDVGMVYCLPTWSRHQKIDRPRKSRFPPPPKPEMEQSASVRRDIVEPSSNPRRGSDLNGSEGSEGSLARAPASKPKAARAESDPPGERDRKLRVALSDKEIAKKSDAEIARIVQGATVDDIRRVRASPA